MKLYVGNLPLQASEEELRNWFAREGFSSDRVRILRDRYTGEVWGAS